MSPLTRFEAIGIFGAVAVMAIALVLIRMDGTENSGISRIEGQSQVGTVVVAGDSVDDTRAALTDSVGLDGELKSLVIDDVRIGNGEVVTEGDTVVVEYIGRLQDGTEFDNSYERGEPFTFTVGEGRVIAGWEKGLIGMKVGGERILVVPPDMAYGNRQVGPIPANSPLIFSIALQGIE